MKRVSQITLKLPEVRFIKLSGSGGHILMPLLKKTARKASSLISDLQLRQLNPALQTYWKTRLLIIFLLLIAVSCFEVIPAIKQARYAIPSEVFEIGGIYDCKYISDSRLWYSRLNYWLWTSIIITPLLISFIKSTMAKWQKITIILMSIGLCHTFLILAEALLWDIDNGPFWEPDSYYALTGGVNCYSPNDTGPIAAVIVLGWIPSSLYTGFWLFIRWAISQKQWISTREKTRHP